MEFISNNKKTLMVIGGIAAIVIIGKIANDKNGWFDKLMPKKKNELKPDQDYNNQTITPVPIDDPAAKKAAPRGKLPWAVGDVSLWDDEDPNYCGNCATWCNEGFSGAHSTQCDMCQSKCPGVRRY